MTDNRRPATPRRSATPAPASPRSAKDRSVPARQAKPRTGTASKAAPKDAPRKPARKRRGTSPSAPSQPQAAPTNTTRIVARPPSAPRPSESNGQDRLPEDKRWSRVAIAASSQIRTGPKRAAPEVPESLVAGTISSGKAAFNNVTTRVLERLGERSKAKHRLALIRWSKRAAYVGVAAAAVWLLLLSPLFALDTDKVEASGFGTVVDPTAVDAVMATHAGTSLALLNTSHIANELREIPGVRGVGVERKWPSGLAIVIESREPVAAVPQTDDSYVLVDDEGVQVGTTAQAPDALPVIEVPVGEDHVRVLASVLGVVDELPAEVAQRVLNIQAQTEDSVTFTLRDGPRVEWGSAEQSALKARVLGVMLQSDAATGASVIDVSAPTLPITSKD